MKAIYLLPFLISVLISCDRPPKAGDSNYIEDKQGISPDLRFGQLFIDVQTSGMFPDSKTFADAEPKYPTDQILDRYAQVRESRWFSLKRFVRQYFTLPKTDKSRFRPDTSQTAGAHIRRLMPLLVRQPDGPSSGSLIPLPYPYIVPGGRFRELYYWDSYFTMLGLREMGDTLAIRHMTDNFAFLIDSLGFVPNGSRTYYLSRSQPPFFSLMVQLTASLQGDSLLVRYLPQLEKEYLFWMDGQDNLAPQIPAHRRVVRMPDGRILNRYWDDLATPRPESYRQDLETARNSNRPAAQVFRDLRAACESGWDFSSRWLADSSKLHTIQTTQLAPVDLNALLWNLETTLSQAWALAKRKDKARKYKALAQNRQQALAKYCWDPEAGFFFDYHHATRKRSQIPTLAGVFPLFFGLASQSQASNAAATLEKDFLQPGGLVTTLSQTGQQWDAPNGWAPLQWMAIQGLRNYQFTALADSIQTRWIAQIDKTYRQNGKMMEKYNVIDLNAPGGGGEYPTQDGFGWTNGVFLALEKK
ncbi:MAG: alpha,alpha-trehalase TreF [Haliscomenobacter sp.]|nr:alpha,alpha-trehalase TreF [Haliscomenobacter sp.]